MKNIALIYQSLTIKLQQAAIVFLVFQPTLVVAAEDATGCVSVINVNGGRSFKNNCTYDIEIAWCYVGKDCRNGDWGYTNTWSFPAGSVRTASTFSSDIASSMLKFSACKGANSTITETNARQHMCYD